jgi:uncharacterized membrane protein
MARHRVTGTSIAQINRLATGSTPETKAGKQNESSRTTLYQRLPIIYEMIMSHKI